MKMADVQRIVDEVLEGNEERINELPMLLEDESFRKRYLALMVDESLLATAIELESKKYKYRKKKKKPVLFRNLTVLAAVLMCAFGLFYFYKNQTSVIVAGGSSQYPSGTSFNAGSQLILDKSETLLLEFSDKSQLNLRGPFEGKVAENGIRIVKGSVEADIQKRTENKFTITTADCHIEVLGTKFSVSALESSTELKVKEGEVKIQKEQESLNVLGGEFVMASSSVPFKVFKQNKKDIPGAVWRERYKHRIMKELESEDLISLYTFEDSEKLQNLAGDYLHGQIPEGLQKVKGRHGKGARLFDDKNGHVIECGHDKNYSLKNFTAVLWCKAEKGIENNVLLSQRDFDQESLGGWSIHIIDGYLTVWLVTGFHKKVEIEWSKNRIAKFPLNKWQQIALSVKGNSVSVFLDDKKVKELNVDWQASRHIKHLAIGGIDLMSFKYRNFKRPRNIFNGAIDEVRLYKRPLNETEIQDLFQQGKP